MNISRENVDALNAVITLKIEQADYASQVENAIKSYAKRVNMPGFRPGKAPVALIKKQVGKAIMAEEVNKIMDEKLSNYIKDEKLNIVGQPLPAEGQEPIDFDKEVTDITFKFAVGLIPDFKVDLSKISVPYYTIELTDKEIDKRISTYAQQFGSNEKVEAVGEKSVIKGSIKQDGAFSYENAIVSLSVIKDDAEKAKFVGKKVGDVISFDLKKAYPNDIEISYILGISKEDAATVNGNYDITIAEITEYKEAEINQDLFDRVWGKDAVKSADEFRAKTREALEYENTDFQETLFAHTFRKELVKTIKIDLPEEFMKRWLTVINKDNKNFTTDVLTNEFPQLLDEYRWSEIRQKIVEDNELKLNDDDILGYAKRIAKSQFMQYGINNVPGDALTNYAQSFFKDHEQRERIFMGALDRKVAAFAKDKVKLDQKTKTLDEASKLFED